MMQYFIRSPTVCSSIWLVATRAMDRVSGFDDIRKVYSDNIYSKHSSSTSARNLESLIEASESIFCSFRRAVSMYILSRSEKVKTSLVFVLRNREPMHIYIYISFNLRYHHYICTCHAYFIEETTSFFNKKSTSSKTQAVFSFPRLVAIVATENPLCRPQYFGCCRDSERTF